MRAPSVRVVLVGLAAVAVLVVGSLATRGGPLSGRGPESGGTARSSTANGEPATSLPTLGSISDQLARLPPVAPGDLAGVLDVADNDCAPDQVDLDTLQRNVTRRYVCAAPGAKFGIRDEPVAGDHIDVLDLGGRRVDTMVVPSGWAPVDMTTRRGIVVCNAGAEGRLLVFLGGTARLPSCPMGQTRDGRLLFVSADRRSVVDDRGRRVLTAPTRLPRFPNIRELGDGLLAVDAELYRDGRRIASYGKPGLTILGASRDGKVALLQQQETKQLSVYHDAVLNPLDAALSGEGGGGVVAPDGRRILIQRDRDPPIEIDAATRRPLARLDLGFEGSVIDWRLGGPSLARDPT